jgi:hypothetical protein
VARTPSSLGDIPIDAQQSLIKTYCANTEAHRVIQTGVEYNKVEYEYRDNGQVCTIAYIYECTAEKSKVEFVADCCGNLCGTTWIIHASDNDLAETNEYKIIYCIACGATIPEDFNSTVHIPVVIQACDAIPVINLATKQALEANTKFTTDFTIKDLNTYLEITALKKGEATDAVDFDTGFTISTLTQGSKTQVEKLNFLYDNSNKLEKIITTSGENIFGSINPSELTGEFKVLGSAGNVARVTESMDLGVSLDKSQNETLQNILLQLKIMNNHLASITGESICEQDLDLHSGNK